MISIGVLASGRGSNFAALLKHHAEGRLPGLAFTCLVSDKPGAPALAVADKAGVPAYNILPRGFPDKVSYEREVVQVLKTQGCEWICLAGYMRIIGDTMLDAFPNRILNIHPSLLPSFPGLHAQKQALDYGVRVSGCTVHLVDSGMDTGPIVAQQSVPVLPGDTEDTLGSRILVQEHALYAQSLRRITSERWHLKGRQLHFNEALE